MFKMTFDTDNSAFDFGNKEDEIARILRDVAEEIESGEQFGIIYDGNGNNIGIYDIAANEA